MGAALFIVLDNEKPGFNTMVDGKAIGKAANELDEICRSIGLPSIHSFVSMSMDEISDMLGDKLAQRLPEVAVKWFDADAGLRYFERLAARLEENPGSLARADRVLADIAGYLSVVRQAKAIGAKWRLCVDT